MNIYLFILNSCKYLREPDPISIQTEFRIPSIEYNKTIHTVRSLRFYRDVILQSAYASQFFRLLSIYINLVRRLGIELNIDIDSQSGVTPSSYESLILGFVVSLSDHADCRGLRSLAYQLKPRT